MCTSEPAFARAAIVDDRRQWLASHRRGVEQAALPRLRLGAHGLAGGGRLVEAEGGPPVYGLADAARDHDLYLCLHQAAATGEPVRTEPQPWEGSLLDPTAVGGEPLAPVVDDRGTSEGRL